MLSLNPFSFYNLIIDSIEVTLAGRKAGGERGTGSAFTALQLGRALLMSHHCLETHTYSLSLVNTCSRAVNFQSCCHFQSTQYFIHTDICATHHTHIHPQIKRPLHFRGRVLRASITPGRPGVTPLDAYASNLKLDRLRELP